MGTVASDARRLGSNVGVAPGRLRAASALSTARMPPAFQILLGFYIVFTGSLPTIVQALAFGVQGPSGSEFLTAMLTAVIRDLLLLAPVIILANHPLGILHPLVLGVVMWPLVVGMPQVIEGLGGWTGVFTGTPVPAPHFEGLLSQSPSSLWFAIAKYNALEVLSLACTYAGFWIVKAAPRPPIKAGHLNSTDARFVLMALIALSVVIVLTFVSIRGGIAEHLTSLGRGRFHELAGDGIIIVAVDTGAIALYLWIAARPGDVRTPVFLGALALVTASQFISNGSRGSALGVPVMIGIIWALQRRKVPWKTAFVLLPLMFAAIGLLGAIRTASWGGSTAGEALTTTGWTQSIELAQNEIAQRRSVSADVPVIERGMDVTGGPMLGSTYLAAIGAPIPRAIWEDKPRGPGSIYAQLFMGVSVLGTTIPVSPVAEMYWNFGIVGVLLLSLLYGAILHWIYLFYLRRSANPIAVVAYVLLVTGFKIGTNRIVYVEQQLGLVFICGLVLALFVPRPPPELVFQRTSAKPRMGPVRRPGGQAAAAQANGAFAPRPPEP